jgi:hypothetical protein
MRGFRDVKEVLRVFAPLLIEFSFDMKHSASRLRAPFVVKLGLDRVGHLNQVNFIRSENS